MNDLKKTWIVVSCLVLSVVPVVGQAVPQKPTSVTAVPVAMTDADPMSDARPTAAVTRVVVVSLEDRRLALVEDGMVKKVFPVAVGKETTPSPTGQFTIVDRVENPTYYHQGEVVPPGPRNPVGTRWIGLDEKGYGIHGTNAPHSIGKAASHGCIRMGRRDLEELFTQVRSGDQVEIIGERNETTAAIFGTPVVPAVVASPQTLTAQVTPEAPPQSTAAVVAVTVPVSR